MGWNPIDFITDLVGDTYKLNIELILGTADAAEGDMEGALRHYVDGLELAFESQAAGQQIALYMAILAASIAYGQLAAALANGAITVPGTQTAIQISNAVRGQVNILEGKLQSAFGPLFGKLNYGKLTAHYQNLKSIHRIARILHRPYRDFIAQVFDNTRELSRGVFGDANTVQQALNLLQMVTYDTTRLQGKPVDVAENRYFDAMLRVSASVRGRSHTYTRNPGAFWNDINDWYLLPLRSEQFNAESQRDGRMARLGERINTVSGAVTAADKRFDDYRVSVNPFLERDKLLELDRIRREYQLEVKKPLADLGNFFAEEYPRTELKLDALANQNRQQQQELDAVSEITADPNTLSDEQQAAQRDRVSSWLDNLPGAGTTTTDPLQATHEGVTSLFERLQKRD